ncbi:MAG: prepilin-type N-terminal cleavage/methylation domain-containing protein [Desulfobacteraceae bacterium]|nr:prepilin-type N-terminal cleavage/methylation domain-containing protein [Desulfobacteraceae bacterium]
MMKGRKTSKGFTLMELMISMVIFSIVIAGIVSSKMRQQGQHITQLQAVEMQQSVRAVMSLMKQGLRMAGYNPSSMDYGEGFITAGADNLTISIVESDDGDDNNNDGQIDEEGELETIAYALQDPDNDGDNDITISYNGAGAQVLAENILNLGFTYFDIDMNLTPTLTDIKSIQITITVATDVRQLARATNNSTRTLTTIVYLRNMGL